MKRYKHNLSHYNLVSGHPGYLLPVVVSKCSLAIPSITLLPFFFVCLP